MKKFAQIALICAVAGAFLSTEAYNGKNVNAKAVSTQWRSYKWFNDGLSSLACEGYENAICQGSIQVFTIQNGKTTNTNTIYNRDQGFAQYPAFDLTGTKIAFFRKATGPEGSNGAGNCVSKNDGKSHISIINTNGTGLRDLCDLPGTPGMDEALDWPAGDWIYYVSPKSPTDALAAGGSKNTNSFKIWKVNVNDGSTNQVVCDFNSATSYKCQYWRRFSLDLTATHMAVETQSHGGCSGDLGNPANSNSLFNFPPTSCNPFPTPICTRPGCNMAISPGGAIVGSYFAGRHNQLYLNGTDINHPDKDGFYQRCGESLKILDLSTEVGPWTGESWQDAGIMGSEHIGWAVNSEKWVLQDIGWYGHAERVGWGSNQVAANWVDQAAIQISHNPKNPLSTVPNQEGPLGICISNSTGDMWIDDPTNNPTGNKYEDLAGGWHEVPGATLVGNKSANNNRSASSALINNSRISMPLYGNGPWSIAISSANGRLVHIQRGIGSNAQISTDALKKGVYMAKITSQSGSNVQRFVVR